jgi:hypothetical protein
VAHCGFRPYLYHRELQIHIVSGRTTGEETGARTLPDLPQVHRPAFAFRCEESARTVGCDVMGMNRLEHELKAIRQISETVCNVYSNRSKLGDCLRGLGSEGLRFRSCNYVPCETRGPREGETSVPAGYGCWQG